MINFWEIIMRIIGNIQSHGQVEDLAVRFIFQSEESRDMGRWLSSSRLQAWSQSPDRVDYHSVGDYRCWSLNSWPYSPCDSLLSSFGTSQEPFGSFDVWSSGCFLPGEEQRLEG